MRKLSVQVFVILFVAFLPAIVCAFVHPRRPSWDSNEVTVGAAKSWGASVLWIDARSRDDFEREHVNGALLLNEDEWDALVPEVVNAWSEETRIVVYCSSLSCHTSREVARRLREEVGLPKVYVLKGGWEAWLQNR